MRMFVGDYDSARDMWLASLEIYEQLGIDLEVGRVHAELAALANASGDPQAAIEYGRVAAEIFTEEEFLRLIVLGNLAESYEQSGRNSKVLVKKLR